jgi:hypothetical protein
MIKRILSDLLHHANREYRSDEFYRVKDRILTKYGKVVGHDVQFIEGKKCNSCQGRGYHYKYGRNGKPYDTADCNHCWGGWYKQPAWVLLQRIQFGKYIFHKPFEKKFGSKNPFIKECGVNKEIITGYIDHSRTKYGKDARVILFLLYDWKGYWKRWYKAIGSGWYSHRSVWWTPRRWPNNIAHIIRYKHKAIPFMKMKRWVAPVQEPDPDPTLIPYGSPIPPDDLPF